MVPALYMVPVSMNLSEVTKRRLASVSRGLLTLILCPATMETCSKACLCVLQAAVGLIGKYV